MHRPAPRGPTPVVIDVRGSPGCRERSPTFRDGISRRRRSSSCASTLDPALMLEAMRSGINEWRARAAERATWTPRSRRVGAAAAVTPTARCSPSSAPRAASARTTVAVNLATATRRARQRSRRCDRPAHGAAATPRCSSASSRASRVLDALENIQRLDETYFKGLITTHQCGVDLLASPSARHGVDGRAARPAAARVRRRGYRYVVLDCPRTDSAVLEALDAATASSWSPTRSWRRCAERQPHGGQLRQRCGANRVKLAISRFDPESEISRRTSSGYSAAGQLHVSQRLSHLLAALNAGEPLIVQQPQAGWPELRRACARLAGCAGREAPATGCACRLSRTSGGQR